VQGIPGVEERFVALRRAGVLHDGFQRQFEGVPFGSHLRHAGVVDGDRVIERLLGGIDPVGLLPQTRVGGQGDEAGGSDGGTERAEDPLGDQQVVQVRLAQGALGQAREAAGDEIGEQAHPAALRAHALHGGPLPLQFCFPSGEDPLEPFQEACDVVVAVGASGSRVGEGAADVVQGDPGVGHPADPQQPDHLVVAVAATVVAAPLGLGEQTDLVVVTDRPRCGADERRRVPDRDVTRRDEGQVHERGLLGGAGRGVQRTT
jgi:hypothetical protein